MRNPPQISSHGDTATENGCMGRLLGLLEHGSSHERGFGVTSQDVFTLKHDISITILLSLVATVPVSEL